MNSNIKELLLGNAAVARGLYEAGISVVSGIPRNPFHRNHGSNREIR